MDFWTTFVSESLQSPWMIRPKQIVDSSTEDTSGFYIFLVEELLPDEAYSMVSKMILAINLKPEEVTILNQGDVSVHWLSQLSSAKKIISFGDEFPGEFGEWVRWMGHEVIKTHSLKTLVDQPQHKKETWMHLKKFGQIQ